MLTDAAPFSNDHKVLSVSSGVYAVRACELTFPQVSADQSEHGPATARDKAFTAQSLAPTGLGSAAADQCAENTARDGAFTGHGDPTTAESDATSTHIADSTLDCAAPTMP